MVDQNFVFEFMTIWYRGSSTRIVAVHAASPAILFAALRVTSPVMDSFLTKRLSTAWVAVAAAVDVMMGETMYTMAAVFGVISVSFQEVDFSL